MVGTPWMICQPLAEVSRNAPSRLLKRIARPSWPPVGVKLASTASFKVLSQKIVPDPSADPKHAVPRSGSSPARHQDRCYSPRRPVAVVIRPSAISSHFGRINDKGGGSRHAPATTSKSVIRLGTSLTSTASQP